MTCRLENVRKLKVSTDVTESLSKTLWRLEESPIKPGFYFIIGPNNLYLSIVNCTSTPSIQLVKNNNISTESMWKMVTVEEDKTKYNIINGCNPKMMLAINEDNMLRINGPNDRIRWDIIKHPKYGGVQFSIPEPFTSVNALNNNILIGYEDCSSNCSQNSECTKYGSGNICDSVLKMCAISNYCDETIKCPSVNDTCENHKCVVKHDTPDNTPPDNTPPDNTNTPPDNTNTNTNTNTPPDNNTNTNTNTNTKPLSTTSLNRNLIIGLVSGGIFVLIIFFIILLRS